MIKTIIEKLKRYTWYRTVILRLQSVRIKYKILGLAIGLMLLLSVMLVWQTSTILTTNLRDQLDKRAVSIGSDVAARATNQLLISNTYAVYELIKNTLRNNEDVQYIFVVDPKGNVLAHTFGEGFPNDLLKVNNVAGDEKYHLSVLRSEVGIIRDVAVPILDGKLGTVRVGMNELGLQKAVLNMTRSLLLVALFVSALGILAAILLTKVLTNPIRELVLLTQRVTQGEMEVQGVVYSQDEIGLLTTAFNEMTKSISWNHKEQEKLLAKLKEKEEMRLQLLDKVMIAQEEERKRISRELHDETSQALTSLMVGLKVLESEASFCEVQGRLQEMRKIVSQTLEEVHHLALELRPSVLDDMGLVAALERYVRDYEKKYLIKVDFHVNGFQNKRVSSAVEVAFYRIVQEALTNVAKYAKAENISVLLDWREDWASVIVEDDGLGFNPSLVTRSPGRGLGLFGMQERAALLGGTFKVESQPGMGTTVFIKIPAESAEQGKEDRNE